MVVLSLVANLKLWHYNLHVSKVALSSSVTSFSCHVLSSHEWLQKSSCNKTHLFDQLSPKNLSPKNHCVTFEQTHCQLHTKKGIFVILIPFWSHIFPHISGSFLSKVQFLILSIFLYFLVYFFIFLVLPPHFNTNFHTNLYPIKFCAVFCKI